MKISEKGLQRLIVREGKRNKAYKDTKGIWTAGVGDTDLDNDGTRDVLPTTVLTDPEIARNLQADLIVVEQTIAKTVFVPLTQNQYDALVSFIFNVGINAFRRSTMLKFINLRMFDKAAAEFDRWHKPPEIVGRRTSEREQFKEI